MNGVTNDDGLAWPASSLKRFGSLLGGSGFPIDEQGFSEEEMELPFFKVKDLAGTLTLTETNNYISRETAIRLGATIFPKNTIVFAKVGAALLLNRFRVLGCEGCLDNNMMALLLKKPHEVGFFLHLLNASDLSSNFNQGPVPSVNTRQVGALRVTVPPPFEQKRIAPYLDASCAAIDAAVSAKRRQLDTLEALRKSIIQRAVTFGIEANPKLRQVNSDWIREVPSHWDVCRVKRVVARMDYGIGVSTGDEGRYPVLKMGNVQDGEIQFAKLDFIDEVDDNLILERGDLLYNRTNSPDQVGKAAIFRKSRADAITFASYLVRLRVNHRVNAWYLNYVLNSSGFLAFARRLAVPSVQQSNLNSTRYAQMFIPLPPIEEQKAILSFLNEKTAAVDTVVATIQTQIETLTAYRKSLIHECVTGQRRVTEADVAAIA